MSSLLVFILFMKLIQDPTNIFQDYIKNYRHRTEEYNTIISFILILVETHARCIPLKVHRILGALLAILSCRSLMNSIGKIEFA